MWCQNLKQYWRDEKKNDWWRVMQWHKSKSHLRMFYIWFIIFPEQSSEVWQFCFWSTATTSPTRLQDGIMHLGLNIAMHYSIRYVFHLSITFWHYLWNHDPLTGHRPGAQMNSESSDLKASSLLSAWITTRTNGCPLKCPLGLCKMYINARCEQSLILTRVKLIFFRHWCFFGKLCR